MTKVSIIVPSYNEGNLIKECVKSLNNQNFDSFQIIVVDDGSTDKSIDTLKELHLNNLDIHNQNHLGAGAARNLGAKFAKGEVLVFVDADMTFDRNFIKNLTKPIFANKTKGTFSKDESVSNWKNVWARCWSINQGWEPKKMHGKNYPSKQKVFRAILKKEFDKVGGFTPGGYTDDYSLYEKLGYLADCAENAYFYHKNPGNLREVFVQARWSAKRKYKFGAVGYVFAILRSLLPFSLIVGLVKAIKNMEFRFILFKVVYDLGILAGILTYLLGAKKSK